MRVILISLFLVGCATGPLLGKYHAGNLGCNPGDTQLGLYCYTETGLNNLCGGGEKYLDRYGVCDGRHVDN